MMNNPVRSALQRHYEARRLEKMGGRVDGKRCLEIGCGRGVGSELILDHFGAGTVDAFDLDPHMVGLAKRRLARRGARVRLWAGSATDIEAPDGVYDAAFDFGIVHHIPDWQSALAEVFRVLRPGGRFFAEEVLERFILHPVWRRVLEHPLENRFDRQGFERGLERAGFSVRASGEVLGQFAFFVADKPGSA